MKKGRTAIADTQKDHLHDVASVRYPPASDLDNSPKGPIHGPNNGPNIHAAIAPPLFSLTTISAIVPAPIVTGHEPAIPANSLNTINAPRFGATAHAMLKIRKITLQTW